LLQPKPIKSPDAIRLIAPGVNLPLRHQPGSFSVLALARSRKTHKSQKSFDELLDLFSAEVQRIELGAEPGDLQ